MMKASEVFDLPVSAGEHNMDSDSIYGASGNGEWCATFCSDEQAKVAANCINHADALADALAACMSIIGNAAWRDDAHKQDYEQAVSAIEAYRGAK